MRPTLRMVQVLQGLFDRNADRRKAAAADLAGLVRQWKGEGGEGKLQALVEMLAEHFVNSSSITQRKGGLSGIAAVAATLRHETSAYLNLFIPSVLTCFSDTDAGVRQQALDTLFNIVQYTEGDTLPYLNVMFVGLCKLAADVDPDVKNLLELLDGRLKGMVSSARGFDVAAFVPLLRDHASSSDMYIRRLFVSWVTTLDSVPEINMLEYLPDTIDGLFNMLSDANKELRSEANACLEEFLQQIAAVPREDFEECVAFQPIVASLVRASNADNRYARVTAMQWLYQLIDLAGDILAPVYAPLLDTVLARMGDSQQEIVEQAFKTADLFMSLLQRGQGELDITNLLRIVTDTLPSQDQLQRSESLRWTQMLLAKFPDQVMQGVEPLLLALLHNLTDESVVDVLKLNLDTLARLALHDRHFFFTTILKRLLTLLAGDRRLLEARGAFIVRRLCLLLDARDVYVAFARLLRWDPHVEFVAVFVELLSLVLLTSGEMKDFRTALRGALRREGKRDISELLPATAPVGEEGEEPPTQHVDAADLGDFDIFATLLCTWCHNPISTVALCLLGEGYELAQAVVASLVEAQVSVGLLMQLDKLVQLIESPVFVQLRVHLVHPERRDHQCLLRCLYALLMLLPQSTAFGLLRDRLQSTTSLHIAVGGGSGGSWKPLLPSPEVASVPDAELAKRMGAVMAHYKACQAWRTQLTAAQAGDTEVVDSESGEGAAAS